MTQSNPKNALFGMHKHSGKHTQNPPLEHIKQCLNDIFLTPIGSRIARRDYGSYLFEMIDQPMTPENQLRLVAALCDAAHRFEPRVTLQSALLHLDLDGKITLEYTAKLTQTPQSFKAQSALR